MLLFRLPHFFFPLFPFFPPIVAGTDVARLRDPGERRRMLAYGGVESVDLVDALELVVRIGFSQPDVSARMVETTCVGRSVGLRSLKAERSRRSR